MDNITESSSAPGQKKGKWRELFIDKFIDLVMVILGIYIAFQIDKWKDASDQRALEKYYFQSITSDLDKDVAEYERHLQGMHADAALAQRYLSKTSAKGPDSLGYVVVNMLSFETFTGNRNTYLTLLSGNGLNVIQDRRIHTLLTEYYNLYSSLERFDKVYTDLIYKANDYFIQDINYSTMMVSGSRLNSIATTNYLFVITNELLQGIEDYEEVLARAQRLRERIAEYLK